MGRNWDLAAVGTGCLRAACNALAAFLFILLVGYLDWITGTEVSMSLLYLLPILMAAWCTNGKAMVALAIGAAGLWMAIEALAAPPSHPLVPVWNALVRLGIFLLTGSLLLHIRSLSGNLDLRVQERTATLQAEVIRRQLLEREAVQISQREQTRVAHELHDNLGAHLGGLAFRLKALSEGLQRAFGIKCHVEAPADLPQVSPEQTLHLQRIAQEAVRNAVQHGKAMRVDVRVEIHLHALTLTVRNDGISWKPEREQTHGLGLRIMHHRTGILGGTLQIQPDAQGHTNLRCNIPLSSDTVPAEEHPHSSTHSHAPNPTLHRR